MIRPDWRTARDFATDAISEYGKDRGGTLAAALAFYAAFSLSPLFLGLIAVAAAFISPAQAQELVFRYAAALLVSQRDFLAGTVAGVVEARGALGLVAALLLLWSGKNLFLALEDTLEQIYQMQRPPGAWGMVRANARALGWYLGGFARLNAVYGPISGVTGFYLWLDLTGTIVIRAAEIGAVWCRRVHGTKSVYPR